MNSYRRELSLDRAIALLLRGSTQHPLVIDPRLVVVVFDLGVLFNAVCMSMTQSMNVTGVDHCGRTSTLNLFLLEKC